MNRTPQLLRAALAFVCLLCFGSLLAPALWAQTTTITASKLKMGGFLISTGEVIITPVGAYGTPIAFADGTGAQNGPTAFACQIVAGVITGAIGETGTVSGTCQVPDATMTIPANILYSIQVVDQSSGLRTSGQVYTLQQIVGVSGATWALDHYGPPASTTNIVAVQNVQGTTLPTSCVAPAIYTLYTAGTPNVFAGLYTCVGGVYVSISTSGTASITVGTVTGLAAGSSPTVTNSGTGATATFNFGIPAGATGPTGPQGPTGATGPQGPAGTGSATLPAQVISGLSYSPSATTIVATWYTSGQSNSALSCGGKAAVDNNVQASTTFHQAIVTGLTPATLYACSVASGATSSTAQNVTTAAAPTRTPITSAILGSVTLGTAKGDSFPSFVSNDNATYMLENDGYGLAASVNAGANMQIAKITDEAIVLGAPVNLWTNYGAFASANGTDGPSGAALSSKVSGIFGMSGNLYVWTYRQYDGASGGPPIVSPALYGNIIKSTDHGLTWNNWQNIPQASPNGVPTNPLGSYQFATSSYANCVPVRYAMDDGSNGYLTPGNRIDGADAFVYAACNNGYWSNGSNLYEMRMARASLLQNPGAPQYWIGPSSPAPADFVNDANWSTSATGATSIYSATAAVSVPDLFFVPGVNEYILQEWNYPGTPASNTTAWNILSGPTPAGPWTSIYTNTFNPMGYYNPEAMHRTFATNTASTNIALMDVFAGDFESGASTYYHPNHATLTLNPSGVASATPTFSPVAGSYGSTQSVAISTTAGSVICYNTTGSPATNGATGCATGTLYTAPVSVASTETLYAVAGGTGYADSAVASAAYTISTTVTYLNTVFNEAAAGTNLAGTTPVTCASGCVGPWALASGADWTYQSGGGISTSTANTIGPGDLITAGPANSVVRFTLAAVPASSASNLMVVSLRVVDSNNYIQLHICTAATCTASGVGIHLYDTVSGTTTSISSSVSGTYVGNYTITLNGSTVTAVTPSGTITGTTANTTGTGVGLFLYQQSSGPTTMTALSVKNQ